MLRFRFGRVAVSRPCPDLLQRLVVALRVHCVASVVSRPIQDQQPTIAAPFRALEPERAAPSSTWTVGSRINGPRLLPPRGRERCAPSCLGRPIQDQRPRIGHVEMDFVISRSFIC